VLNANEDLCRNWYTVLNANATGHKNILKLFIFQTNPTIETSPPTKPNPTNPTIETSPPTKRNPTNTTHRHWRKLFL